MTAKLTAPRANRRLSLPLTMVKPQVGPRWTAQTELDCAVDVTAARQGMSQPEFDPEAIRAACERVAAKALASGTDWATSASLWSADKELRSTQLLASPASSRLSPEERASWLKRVPIVFHVRAAQLAGEIDGTDMSDVPLVVVDAHEGHRKWQLVCVVDDGLPVPGSHFSEQVALAWSGEGATRGMPQDAAAVGKALLEGLRSRSSSRASSRERNDTEMAASDRQPQRIAAETVPREPQTLAIPVNAAADFSEHASFSELERLHALTFGLCDASSVRSAALKTLAAELPAHLQSLAMRAVHGGVSLVSGAGSAVGVKKSTQHASVLTRLSPGELLVALKRHPKEGAAVALAYWALSAEMHAGGVPMKALSEAFKLPTNRLDDAIDAHGRFSFMHPCPRCGHNGEANVGRINRFNCDKQPGFSFACSACRHQETLRSNGVWSGAVVDCPCTACREEVHRVAAEALPPVVSLVQELKEAVTTSLALTLSEAAKETALPALGQLLDQGTSVFHERMAFSVRYNDIASDSFGHPANDFLMLSYWSVGTLFSLHRALTSSGAVLAGIGEDRRAVPGPSPAIFRLLASTRVQEFGPRDVKNWLNAFTRDSVFPAQGRSRWERARSWNLRFSPGLAVEYELSADTVAGLPLRGEGQVVAEVKGLPELAIFTKTLLSLKASPDEQSKLVQAAWRQAASARNELLNAASRIKHKPVQAVLGALAGGRKAVTGLLREARDASTPEELRTLFSALFWNYTPGGLNRSGRAALSASALNTLVGGPLSYEDRAIVFDWTCRRCGERAAARFLGGAPQEETFEVRCQSCGHKDRSDVMEEPLRHGCICAGCVAEFNERLPRAAVELLLTDLWVQLEQLGQTLLTTTPVELFERGPQALVRGAKVLGTMDFPLSKGRFRQLRFGTTLAGLLYACRNAYSSVQLGSLTWLFNSTNDQNSAVTLNCLREVISTMLVRRPGDAAHDPVAILVLPVAISPPALAA